MQCNIKNCEKCRDDVPVITIEGDFEGGIIRYKDYKDLSFGNECVFYACPMCGDPIFLYGIEYIETKGEYYFLSKEEYLEYKYSYDLFLEYLNIQVLQDNEKIYFCNSCWSKIKQIKEGYNTESPIEEILLKSIKENFPLGKYEIKTQEEILNGKYRVDFIISSKDINKEKSLIVECDGHEFHEKTKKQAQKDKKRDRECLLAGYNVMRFTGSEIYYNTEECIEDIKNYFNPYEWRFKNKVYSKVTYI